MAVDNPHANKLTVHILAAVAQHEREMISERTKAALAAAKRRGKRLGNPNLPEAAKRGVAAIRSNARRFAANVRPITDEINLRVPFISSPRTPARPSRPSFGSQVSFSDLAWIIAMPTRERFPTSNVESIGWWSAKMCASA